MTAACDERRRLAAVRGTREKIQVIPYSLDLRSLWGARRRRLASTVHRESVSRRNFSLERPGGPHQQSNTHRGGLVAKGPHQGNPIVARLPSVAHILKKSRVSFALGTVDPRDRMSVIGVTLVQGCWFYDSLGETTHL